MYTIKFKMNRFLLLLELHCHVSPSASVSLVFVYINLRGIKRIPTNIVPEESNQSNHHISKSLQTFFKKFCRTFISPCCGVRWCPGDICPWFLFWSWYDLVHTKNNDLRRKRSHYAILSQYNLDPITFIENLVGIVICLKKLRPCGSDFNLNGNEDLRKVSLLKSKYNICLGKVSLFPSLVQIHYLNVFTSHKRMTWHE